VFQVKKFLIKIVHNVQTYTAGLNNKIEQEVTSSMTSEEVTSPNYENDDVSKKCGDVIEHK
jgi:hypothetical protein